MCTVFGYARVSTLKQKLERQIDNIKSAFPSAVIVTDKYTGKSIDRPAFTRLIKTLKPGDTVVFDSASRMSRNAEEGIKLYFDLYERGITLVFLKERHIDTDSYKQALETAGINIGETDGTAEGDLISGIVEAINKFMRAKASQDITKAFEAAQKEVDEKSQSTKEGIAQARLKGKTIGREQGRTYETKKSIEMKEKIRTLSKDFDGTLSDKKIMDDYLKISRNSFYKYKKQLLESR